ncbi:hypothetical protein Ares1_0085 [Vibrio phage Ares1]|nr:hypothetical protein Ares1_0085 [Vibrio phage Ares1]
MKDVNARSTVKRLKKRIEPVLEKEERLPLLVAETSVYYVNLLLEHLKDNAAEIIIKDDKRLQKIIDQCTSHAVNALVCLRVKQEDIVEALLPERITMLNVSTPKQLCLSAAVLRDEPEDPKRWLAILTNLSVFARINNIQRANTLAVVSLRFDVYHGFSSDTVIKDRS